MGLLADSYSSPQSPAVIAPRKSKIFLYILPVIFLLPINAYANAGLPMITYGFPFMIVLFAPVLMIEILIYRVKLDKSFWDAFKVAGIANLYTTVIGYPLSWLLLFVYQILASLLFAGLGKFLPLKLIENQVISFFSIPFVMPAWIAPFYNYPIDLIICLAGMVGLIPAYWITVSSEKKILRKYWSNGEKTDSICVFANRISYLFLYMIVISIYFYILVAKY